MNPILEAGIIIAKIDYPPRELTDEEALRVGQLASRVLEIELPKDKARVYLECPDPQKLLQDLGVSDGASEILYGSDLRLKIGWRYGGARQAELLVDRRPQHSKGIFSFRALPASGAARNEDSRLAVRAGEASYSVMPDTPVFDDIEIIINAFLPPDETSQPAGV